jgi:uncharacterized protein YmfQ (DUF2313 family)
MISMAELYQQHTNEEHTQALSNLLPGGRAFQGKNIDDSNFRQLLRICSPEISRFESLLLEFARERDINNADVYLDRWESALGIPDDCFPGTGDIDERRLHVIVKLACMNVSTREDFIALAEKLGFTVSITSLGSTAYPPYDIPMIPSSLPTSNFVWVVSGKNIVGNVPPYDIPYSLEVFSNVLQRVFEKLKPAMTQIIFVNE